MKTIKTFPLLSQSRKMDDKYRVELPQLFPHLDEVLAFTHQNGIGYTTQELFDLMEDEDSQYMAELSRLRIDSQKRIDLSNIISELHLEEQLNIISIGRYFMIENDNPNQALTYKDAQILRKYGI